MNLPAELVVHLNYLSTGDLPFTLLRVIETCTCVYVLILNGLLGVVRHSVMSEYKKNFTTWNRVWFHMLVCDFSWNSREKKK